VDTGGVGGDRTDFFVSHAGADRAWAEWVAWQLAEAGYTVELGVWDWAAGRNFVTAISDALERCDRVVALFSAAYFDRSRYTTEEWSAAVVHVPGVEGKRLVPVRVEEVPAAQVPAVLRPLVCRDVFGVAEGQARRLLLEAVAGPRRPDRPPVFPGPGTPGRPGGAGPRLPGTVPRIWSIPARNPGFTGRDALLVVVRERLLAGDAAVVQALHGMGGVGKTQLAAEYAHRFAGTYDLAWWVNAGQGGLIGDEFAALGLALECIEAGAAVEAVHAAVLAELRQRGRWLLVFDNAETPADVTPWLPGGGGHVLITSRERGWAEVAAPVEVDVLARAESVALLQARVTGLEAADADQLAAELGDLPLAIAQAAGFTAETGMGAREYLGLLRTRAGQLLAQGVPGSYPRSLAATTGLIAD
jgi:TIR domain/NB-ARC domain